LNAKTESRPKGRLSVLVRL